MNVLILRVWDREKMNFALISIRHSIIKFWWWCFVFWLFDWLLTWEIDFRYLIDHLLRSLSSIFSSFRRFECDFWLCTRLSSDCKRIIQREYSKLSLSSSNDSQDLLYQEKQLTLYLFATLLNRAFSSNTQYSFFVYNLSKLVIDFNQYTMKKNRLIREKIQLIDVLKTADAKWVKFNENQKIVVSIIV